MAWSVSITPEGWQLIYNACHDQKRTFLIGAIREHATQNKVRGRSGWSLYKLSTECLANWVYELIQETDTCDNGGFRYWIDPKGYYKIPIEE
ncbi:hypothetical protein HNQ91_000683 [Filimonas zeae]|uniref:Uncharacterized protein n=1 Tax=Filimonas zeae TaxID=1737353 RepID=A0A917MRI1_9BACT|nr:hypothetical protein [Filimonas zeae]MDR6337661.1 hypothetical protein [Filimonas zeae]GGH59678.1 hypothetical protein GCM10011379_06720 [Filimonas zeae]